jgi:hypothetical protein
MVLERSKILSLLQKKMYNFRKLKESSILDNYDSIHACSNIPSQKCVKSSISLNLSSEKRL